MVTTLHQKTTHTIKIDFSDEPVTSFGGLTLIERMAQRLRLWSTLSGTLPERQGEYDWTTCVKSVVAGLLSGGHGTYAAQCVREDPALLGLLDLEGAPEEATVWRCQQQLGQHQANGRLPRVQAVVARRTLEKMDRPSLLFEDFARVFSDGSLLEGSRRREGTKYIKGKGNGLMWSAVFVGPVLAAQRLSAEGEGGAVGRAGDAAGGEGANSQAAASGEEGARADGFSPWRRSDAEGTRSDASALR